MQWFTLPFLHPFFIPLTCKVGRRLPPLQIHLSSKLSLWTIFRLKLSVPIDMGLRLTRAKLWWLDNWVRSSPRLQLFGVFLVCSGQYMSKMVQERKWWISERVTCEEGRLAHVVWTQRRVTVAQTAEKVNSGSDRKVSEFTEHCSLLCVAVHSRRPVRMATLTHVHYWK